MTRTTRTAAIALTGVIALGGAAACGSSSSGGSSAASGSNSSPSSASSPSPAAQVTSLSGVHTQVTIDPGFLKALASLKVTPGPVGSATISKAGVATFPITG